MRIETRRGVVEGLAVDGVQSYLGLPYAAPPVGSLRWMPPQPPAPWTGVRRAQYFGARPVQVHLDNDMVFRDPGPSEDCLTLNVWTPAAGPDARLPVMVWIFGGGFELGGTSEPRQDGANLARNGVVVVSMNYRLGILGFMTSGALAAASPHGACGNYGLLDQLAALQWVHDNIAAFGGDPDKVTLFGESAGSISVCAHAVSPLSRGLFHRAIGQSGGAVGLHPEIWFRPRAAAQQQDDRGVQAMFPGAALAQLRGIDARALVEAANRAPVGGGARVRFGPQIDGYFLPADPATVFRAHGQHRMPLLAGWTRDEQPPPSGITAAQHRADIETRFPDHAAELLRHYPAPDDAQAFRAASDLATDLWDVVSSTRRWLHDQDAAGLPAYRYRFDLAPPDAPYHPGGHAAFHSAEIPFVFGNLDLIEGCAWRPEHRRLSAQMQAYWTRFARDGNPNGAGLPQWPACTQATGECVMSLGREVIAATDHHRERLRLLDALDLNPRS